MRRKRFLPGLLTLLYTALALAGLPAASFAIEITVCGSGCNYSTISGAINVALSGDTVLVSDGVYSDNINYKGKNITVKSLNGAAVTKIQGSGANSPVVTFSGGETASAVLQGFTIDNQAAAGATRGIFISNNSSPTIKNSIIEGNQMSNCGEDGNICGGAGVFIKSSSPVFQSCTIRNNGATNRFGGGVYVVGSTSGPTFTGTTISNNTSNQSGGGIYSNGAPISLNNCSVNNNATGSTTGYDGGGIYLYGATASATIVGGAVSGNSGRYGAGIYVNGSTAAAPLSINGTSISSNTSGNMGAGMHLANISNAAIINNATISNNTSTFHGAGIFSSGPLAITSSHIDNNKITSGGQQGGGVYLTGARTSSISDSTVNGNTSTGSGGGINVINGAVLTVTRCEINGNVTTASSGGGVAVTGIGSTLDIKQSNINGNRAYQYGGGVFSMSSATVTNCVISGNITAAGNLDGGGFYINGGTTTVMNSTIAGNYSARYGGGIRVQSGTFSVTNSIIWGNTAASTGPEISGSPSVTYSDILGGYSGAGNIKLDPLFVNPQQALPATPTTAGDYHILKGSPVIDAGTLYGAPSEDIDGDVRPQSAGIDMGADELKLHVNTAPVGGYTSDNVIPSVQISQATDVIITWKGRDAESDKATLKSFQYSVDGGVTWNAPTNSDSSSALAANWANNGGPGWTTASSFALATAHSFNFNTRHSDVGVFNGVDQNDVRVRFKLNDGVVDSSYVTSESFRVNNLPSGATPQPSNNATIIRSVEIVAGSSSQITALAGFDGDSNRNGHVSVEYSKDSTWDNSDDKTACGKLTGGSPKVCFISGLKADTTYYVRVTYSDPDGVSGNNEQLFMAHTLSDVSDIFPPTLSIIKPMDGGMAAGNSRYPISIDFTAFDRHSGLRTSSGDVQVIIDGAAYNAEPITGVDDFFTYLWATPTIGSHTVYARARDNAGNLGYSPVATFHVNSTTTEDGIFAGDGKLLVRDNDNQICWDCHGGIKPHSSQYLSPKYGNWSLTCRQCHTPHNTTNIFLVREQIKTPNSGYRDVDFRSAAGRAEYSFANTVTPGTGPCEVCHTRTSNGNDTPRYRNTGTGPGDGSHQNEPFTGKCIQCHDHTRGFSPVSPGDITCGKCHPKQWTPMSGDTATYHMFLTNPDTTSLPDGLGPNAKYPSQNQPGMESEHRRCMMCHADMEVFSPNINPASPGIAYNLRASVTVVPVAGDTGTHTNTDFRGDLSEGGVCLSCHRNEQTKNNAKKKSDGTSKTPPWDVRKFGESAHNFTVANNFKADNSSFKANCVKCHNDELGKDYQKSDYKFGLHDTKNRSMLSNINGSLTYTESALNSTEEHFCYQCHSVNTDGPDNFNPNSDSASARDAYNVEPMKDRAVKIKSMFEGGKTSFHPINGGGPYASLNGLSNSVGKHRVDEGLSLPSGVRSANWNPANDRHVECTDCHNPHAASKEPRSLLTWRANSFDPTGGSFGGQVGGPNQGVWGVEPVYSHLPWNEATSYTKVENVTEMYQLCFKCHSSYAYGASNSYGIPAVAPSPPQIPKGTYSGFGGSWSWSPGPETDMAVEFNPNNYGFHPIMRRGRNQPQPHLNPSWPYFNGGEGNGSGWQGGAGSYTISEPIGAGLVNYDAASKRVTIANGRNFPTYYLIPGWKIQFNTPKPSAAETWYEIKTVDSPTQVTLVSGPSSNLSGVNYAASAGLGWAFVPPYGPWSTITCADCHTTSDSDGPAGPHGSDNPWLLRSPDVNARVDNNLNGTTGDGTDAINSGVWENKKMLCFSCHRRDVYGTKSASGAVWGVGSGEPSFDSGVQSHTEYSRLLVHPPYWAEITDKNVWGIWCMNCHGGDSMGGMHGSNRGEGNAPSWSYNTTPLGVRLRNGAATLGHSITSSGGSCYFGGTEISSCSASFNATYTANYEYTGVE